MHKKTLVVSLIVQGICWGVMGWLLTKGKLAEATVFQATTPTPEPFLGQIYYGTQNVWQVFDHDLPLAGEGDGEFNDYVTHYDGTLHVPVTPTPQGDPYIPGGYGYDEHGGIDYSLQYEPVLAAASGSVQYAGWDNPANHRDGYGLYVILDHTLETNYDTWYGHLSVLTVKTGDSVTVDPNDPGNRNRILGISGNTGAVFNASGGDCPDVEVDPTCGQHLHFEVRISGGQYKPVNPYGWIAVSPNGTPTPDPWAIYPSGATSYDIWQNKPAIIVGETDQYPGGTPVAEPAVHEARMVVDDGSADFTVVGSWSTIAGDNSYNNFYRQTTAVTPTPNPPSNSWVRWYIRPDAFTPPGEYDLYVYIPGNLNASRGAVYTIQHNMQQSQAIVVQAVYAETWVYIGRHDFLMDNSFTEYIQLSNQTLEGDGDADKFVLADAIRLVPANPATPPFDTLYVSFQDTAPGSRSAGNIPYDAEDILAFDTNSNTWSLLFDGSDVGLANRGVDAFTFATCPNFLFSPNSQYQDIYDHDVAQFIPQSFGTNTSGQVAPYDNNPPDLDTSGEEIDATGFSSNGYLLLSTKGRANVPVYQFEDEDVFLYDPNGLIVPFTSYLDGSAVGLSASTENVNSLWVDAVTDDLYLSTSGSFSVNGASGDGADIFVCDRSSPTSCTFGPGLFWNGSAHGMMTDVVDGLTINTATTSCNTSAWPQYLSDSAHTAHNDVEIALSPPFEERWTFSPNGILLSPPVVYGNLTYVVDWQTATSSKVYALDADGDIEWQTTLPAELVADTSPLLVTSDYLFVVLEDRLYTLDLHDNGSPLGTLSLSGAGIEAPTYDYDANLLYVPADSNVTAERIYAVDVSAGQGAWHFDNINKPSSPVVVNDYLLTVHSLSSSSKLISALDKNTGQEIWVEVDRNILSRHSDLTGNPEHNLIYYVNDLSPEDMLEAFDIEEREASWTHFFPPSSGDGSSSNIILADGILYYNTWEQLYAFDAEEGIVQYHVPLVGDGAGDTFIAMANNIIYVLYGVGDSQGSFVHAYEAATGTFLARLPERPTATFVSVSPTIANGQLYVLYDYSELVVYGQE